MVGQQGDGPSGQAATANGKHPGAVDSAPNRASHERRPEAAAADRIEVPAVAPAGRMSPHAGPEVQVKTEITPGHADSADSTEAKPVRAQDAAETEIKPEAAQAASVHDMKFEVTGGERRVEVRLSERGGEVKMTVRTPDTHLADNLRENLPALSNRLAESGFKSEVWRPAASATVDRGHATESSAGGTARDANQDANKDANRDADGQSRQQKHPSQDSAGHRRSKNPLEPVSQKEKGRNFAWLMSSLR
jgi:hypothetical protein